MALAAEDAPVFERKSCLHCLSEEWIQSILAAFPLSQGLRRGTGCGITGCIEAQSDLKARSSKGMQREFA
jgi:hypothetical protein